MMTQRMFHFARVSYRSLSTTPAAPKRTLRDRWRDGSLLMGVGWGGLTILTVDKALQYIDTKQIADTKAMVAEQVAQDRQRLYAKTYDRPTLYKASITVEYRDMAGSHGLQGVLVGDVVEIVEEKVGPNAAYNLCRIKKDDTTRVGWFPIKFMKRI